MLAYGAAPSAAASAALLCAFLKPTALTLGAACTFFFRLFTSSVAAFFCPALMMRAAFTVLQHKLPAIISGRL